MLGIPQPIKTLYCIGDNVCTDIFGANLYNNYLQRRHRHQQSSAVLANTAVRDLGSRSIDNLVGAVNELSGADACYSVLVETGEIIIPEIRLILGTQSLQLFISGVFKPDGAQYTSLEHSPRDFLPVEKSYQEPTLTTSNVLKAVQTIFRKENWPLV